jgi:propanol-preferring alcohol dehydrogenase
MLLRSNAPIHSRPLVEADVAYPEPGPGQLRVRVHVCGICRTDLHVIEADLPPHKLPLIPGHQVVGTVDTVGAGVKRFKEGDRVGIAWLGSTCGKCSDCKRGAENLCTSSRYTGYDVDGGYAEYVLVLADYAYAIPAAFTDAEAAPLLCAGIIGYRALRLASVPRGGTLTLYGFGSSAHVVLQIAKHRGSSVFVATRGDSHRELARSMGADWVGDTFDAPPEPTDSAIVFAPAGEIVPVALRNVRKAGTVALAGIHMSPIPEMDYEPCLFHEKMLRSVEANTRADGAELLAEAADAVIRPRVTTFPLAQANEALARLADDRIDGSGILEVAD